MADQTGRQPFRFRLPWLVNPAPAPAPAPARAPLRSVVETQPPTQPTTTIPPTQPTTITPSQRPPFRPPGLAPSQPPPQPLAAPRTESQPPSPSRTAPRSQTTSQPPSPSRTAPQPQPAIQTTSQTPSLSQAASQPPSPSRTAPRSLTAPRPQPAIQTASQPPSPPQKVSGSSQPPSPSRKASLPRSPSRATSQLEGVATQPSQISGPMAVGAPTSAIASKTRAPSQTSMPSAITTQPPKSDDFKPEIQKTESELKKEDKPKTRPDEEPKQWTIAKLLNNAADSNTQAKEQPSITSQTEQKQMEKQAILQEKDTAATGFKGRDSKPAVSSHAKHRNGGGESRSKPTTSNGERGSLNKEIREDISRYVHKLAVGHPKQPMEENPASIITVAGENIGATMHLGSEAAKKEGSVHIHRGYKLNQDENAKVNTEEEDSSKGGSNNPTTRIDSASRAYVNSNVQSINNSILYNISFSEKSPGVHLVVLNSPTETVDGKAKTETAEVHKADFRVTPDQKLTYEPTVSKRYLKGFFDESSDSDPDNPNKP